MGFFIPIFLLLTFCASFLWAEGAEHARPVAELTTDNTISVVGSQDGYELIFKCNTEAGVAIFQNGKKWFLIFDKTIPFELAGRANTDQFLQSLRLIPQDTNTKDVTVVEMVLKPSVSFTVSKKQHSWCLNLFFFDPTVPGDVMKQPLPEKQMRIKEVKWPSVQITPVAGMGEIFVRLDGQKYYVVPSGVQEDCINNVPYETPYYNLVNAIQGFVCQLFSESVIFEKKAQEVTITLANELVLSEKLGAQMGQNFSYFYAEDTNWIQYRQKLSDAHFRKDTLTLQDYMEKAWVEVALARGTEALIQVDFMKKNYKGVCLSPLFLALEGMAHFLKKDFDKAIEAFDLVTETEEMVILKMLARAEQNLMVPYNAVLKKALSIFSDYPPFLRSVVLESLLRLLAAFGDFGSVESVINSTHLIGSDLRLKAVFDYFRAHMLIKAGSTEQGVDILREMVASSARRHIPLDIKQEVDVALVFHGLNNNSLSVENGIKLLSEARFRLRSGPVEYRTVRKLIDLLEIQKRYQEMLELANFLQSNYTERALLERMDLKLKKFLLDFFKQDLSKVSPLKILSLYEQYRDLIPSNEEGDKLINIIADEFVSIDLLENAAHILTKWGVQKKTPEERNKILLRVAEIFISDKKYESALAILESMKDLSPDHSHKIVILKARCLSNLSRSIEALNLLKDSKSPEHRHLMVEIYMDYKRWGDAASQALILSELLEGDKSKDLKKNAFLTASIATYLGEDRNKLSQLSKIAPDFVKEDKQFQYLTRDPLKIEASRTNVQSHLEEGQKVIELVKQSLGGS
jgi:hypothetical protein